MLRENIISINELSGLLGHSSPKVTLSHYVSVIDSKVVKIDKDFLLYGHKMVTISENKEVKSRNIGV